MGLVYSFLIRLYGLGISIASIFDQKAKYWVQGRSDLQGLLDSFPKDQRKRIWFHCASLGEFEQGRPLIEELRIRYPKAYILLTFYSPSGYEIRKGYDQVDQVAYLPLDTPSNAKRFVKSLKPDISIFIKYEFWFNFLKNLAEHGKPVILVSAIFRPSQWFFKWYASGFLKTFKTVTHFFVQDKLSADLLAVKGIHQTTVSGDTRFDRVAKLAKEPKKIPAFETLKGQKLFVAGSTWEPDELAITAASKDINSDLVYIIVPHDVSDARVRKSLANSPSPAYRYSELKNEIPSDAKSIIIDQIGLLSSIYYYAHICYVGGGFGKGIHNTLEAAVYGKPVIFGPNFKRFKEARELIQNEGGFSIENSEQLQEITNRFLKDDHFYDRVCNNSKLYVSSNTGATQEITKEIVKYL